jgi:peroxiredoxin
MPALSAGTSAPELTLPTVDGKTFSLADALQRGPVVLAFFKITCPVCQYALPYLERLHQNFRGKNVTIIGVSQNPNADTRAFMREYGVTFPVVLDDPRNYAVSNAYGLTNVPTVFYVAPDGEIELSSVGWSRADMEQLNNRLAEAVNARQQPIFRPGEDVADFKAG